MVNAFEIVNDIVLETMDFMQEHERAKLQDVLYKILNKYDFEEKHISVVADYEADNEKLISLYLKAKMAAGLSNATISQYKLEINLFTKFCQKPIRSTNENDVRSYLFKFRSVNKASTLQNKQAYLSAFFGWLCKNRYIEKNPMDLVEPVKSVKTIKKTLTDEDIIRLKDSCDNIRDLVVIDLLNSSMMRVGELVNIDLYDVDLNSREILVTGKGNKQRQVLFDGETKIHLQQYMSERKDNNPALLVGQTKGSRITVAGVRAILKRIGIKSGIDNVHPHRFRRTGATRCLNAGMPINVVQTLLGHSSVDTTQIYAETRHTTCKQWFNQIYS